MLFILALSPVETYAGGFSVSTFSPWAGYGIPNGQWLTGDINGDGKTDIVHAVQGTDYVHTWISMATGRLTLARSLRGPVTFA
jgi:hypothetical protein